MSKLSTTECHYAIGLSRRATPPASLQSVGSGCDAFKLWGKAPIQGLAAFPALLAVCN